MKQEKRSIQHSFEHPKHHSQNREPANTQKHPQSIDSKALECVMSKDSPKIPTQLAQPFNLQINVQIGDGRFGAIYINQKSDPRKQALFFCNKHNLDTSIVKPLEESLTEHTRKQKHMMKYELPQNIINNNTQDNKQIKGAEKLLAHNRLFKENKKPKQMKKLQAQAFTGHPKINEVSEQIIKKGGKNNIIDTINKKFQDKVHQHLTQQLQHQQKDLQNYSFHPHINQVSRKVDKNLHNSKQKIIRHKLLYNQYKQIQNRKQEQRKNSVNLLSFKPMINKVSKSIIARKKSLGDITSTFNGKQNKLLNHKLHHTIQNQQQSEKQNKSKIKQRLSSSGTHLCYHLYEQAKKRKDKLEKQAERLHNNSKNNWKIMENSNSLITLIRENRIKQVFYNLSYPPHESLHYSQINFNNLTDVQKVFLPLFQEMKQINSELSQDQFIQAGIRLLKYLSPNQKAILTRKYNKLEENNKQNSSAASQVNKKNKEILKDRGSHGQKNIYTRGLMFKNEVKNQIEKGKQEKEKKQLQACTFKPKINGNTYNAAY